MAGRYFVYILTNVHHTVLYTGVTNDLVKRVWEHREGTGSTFTHQYNAKELVFYEAFEDIVAVIEREKQIKAGSRRKKIALIRSMNPDWRDLFPEISS